MGRVKNHIGPKICRDYCVGLNQRPGAAAVGRAPDAAIAEVAWRSAWWGGGPIKGSGCQNDGTVIGVNRNFGDAQATKVAESKLCPVSAAVGALEDARAPEGIGIQVALAGADVDGVGVVWVNRNRANGERGPAIRDGCPMRAAIGRMPDTAIGCACPEVVAVGWVDGHCRDAPAVQPIVDAVGAASARIDGLRTKRRPGSSRKGARFRAAR